MKNGFAPILVLVGILIIAGLIGGAYYLGTRKTPAQQVQNPVVTSPTPLPSVTSVKERDETANWKTYTNTKYGYSVKYPSNWEVIPNPNPRQDEYFTLRSPDYALDEQPGIGSPLINGSEISISVKPAEINSIEEEFNNDILGKQIAQNKKEVVVDLQHAIQYDYSYEGTTATDVRFIKNKLSYLIKNQYPEGQKNKYLTVYTLLLSTFRFD